MADPNYIEQQSEAGSAANKIRILDNQIVNQIAAGEVVERPASVVKELVENSIDSGATEITVVIANGGRSGIEVIDNGSGMNKEDALLAIERYGTSKISRIEDLEAIGTLGFRGEALPSIASVSKFSLSSKARRESQHLGGQSGVEIQIDGGELCNVSEKPQPDGTRVAVRELFYNVPARRKFLRSANTETGMIKSQLQDFAAAHPEVRFALHVDGVQVAAYPKAANFLARVEQLRLVRGQPVIINEVYCGAEGSIKVEGVLSQPLQAVGSGSRLRLIVNGRSVRDKLLLRAVKDGYGSFLKPGKYPAGVIALSISAQEVDVNVHPQKTEVRFRNPQGVYLAVSRAVGRGLHQIRPEDLGGPVTSGQSIGSEAGNPGSGFSRQSVQNPFDFVAGTSGKSSANSWHDDRAAVTFFAGKVVDPAPAAQKLSTMRFVGQIFHLYLLLEGESTFAIVDMHAAHERVKFYQLKSQFVSGNVARQSLLIAETFDLPDDRAADFQHFQPLLQKIGIECEPFGDTGVIVRSLPAILGNASAERIFQDLFALPQWSDWLIEIDRYWDSIIARLACHGSVRSGRELQAAEVYSLLESLEEAEASAFCPHGRPVAIYLSGGELERMFGRSA